ncbi:unnamed protein product [Lactuca saligna]|uniref:Uncharacterized protein n=1 Tax=Lactuca saligna TaxID=75948 RepID=A0AA36EIN1_LACSI|nr:unnamed protein product [Lactuca saligna]
MHHRRLSTSRFHTEDDGFTRFEGFGFINTQNRPPLELNQEKSLKPMVSKFDALLEVPAHRRRKKNVPYFVFDALIGFPEVDSLIGFQNMGADCRMVVTGGVKFDCVDCDGEDDEHGTTGEVRVDGEG